METNKKNFRNEFRGYVAVSPKGIRSDFMSKEELNKVLAKGYFYHTTDRVVADNSIGASTNVIYGKTKCKVAKVLEIYRVSYLEEKEISLA